MTTAWRIPMVARQIVVYLMIMHLAKTPGGELHIVDEMFRLLDEYRANRGYHMPDDVQDKLDRLRITREVYRQAVDDLLDLAEKYEIIDRSEVNEATHISELI